MAKFFYFDQVNQKRGPVSVQQLKELAAQGVIGPQTPMEADTGHKGLAGQISGLFPVSSPPPAQPIPVPPVVPPPPVNLFCTNCGNSVAEKAVACMSCGARPTGHKKFCRQCGVALNPEQVVCVKCGASLTSNFGASATTAATATIANLKSAFQATGAAFTSGSGVGRAASTNPVKASQTTAIPTTSVPLPLDVHQRNKERIHFWAMGCIISYVMYVGIGLGLLAFTAAFPSVAQEINSWADNDTPLSLMGMVFAFIVFFWFPVGITFMICYYFYLRRLWEEIHPTFARTTPGKAALLMLIPVFNMYWQFVAFLGLYKGMNEATESHGLGPSFEKSLIEVVCCGWIPVNILGLIYGFYTNMSPDSLEWLTTGSDLLDTSIGILVPILGLIVTIFVYWIIRKDMLEFIDIKASMER